MRFSTIQLRYKFIIMDAFSILRHNSLYKHFKGAVKFANLSVYHWIKFVDNKSFQDGQVFLLWALANNWNVR